jgi:hypothetical protein
MRRVVTNFVSRVWPDDLKHPGILSDFVFPVITVGIMAKDLLWTHPDCPL